MDKKIEIFPDLKKMSNEESMSNGFQVLESLQQSQNLKDEEYKRLQKTMLKAMHDLSSPLIVLSIIMKFHRDELPDFISEHISCVIAKFKSIITEYNGDQKLI